MDPVKRERTFEERYVIEEVDGGFQARFYPNGADSFVMGPVRSDRGEARSDLVTIRTTAMLYGHDRGPTRKSSHEGLGQGYQDPSLDLERLVVRFPGGAEADVLCSLGVDSKGPSLRSDEPLAVMVGPMPDGGYLALRFEPASRVH